MHSTKEWDCIPNSDLREQTSWRSLGHNRFSALRVRLLIVKRSENNFLYGNALAAHRIAKQDEITIRRKRERVISRTDTFTQAIRLATSSRICDTLSAKLTAELSAKVSGISTHAGSEFVKSAEFERNNCFYAPGNRIE